MPAHGSHQRHHGAHPGSHNASIALASSLGVAPGPQAVEAWLPGLTLALEEERTELVLLVFASMLCAAAWLFGGESAGVDEVMPGPPSPGGMVVASSSPLRSGKVPHLPTPRELALYRRLRNRYMLVYSLATFGDWIQGGYLYALYSAHGYAIHDIALLFVVRGEFNTHTHTNISEKNYRVGYAIHEMATSYSLFVAPPTAHHTLTLSSGPTVSRLSAYARKTQWRTHHRYRWATRLRRRLACGSHPSHPIPTSYPFIL